MHKPGHKPNPVHLCARVSRDVKHLQPYGHIRARAAYLEAFELPQVERRDNVGAARDGLADLDKGGAQVREDVCDGARRGLLAV